MRSGGMRTGGWLIGLILAFALPLPSHADEQHDHRRDHDRARRALEVGEILPLKTILENIALDTPGEVMEVELERKGERWVYEIKLLRAGGSLVKLKVDARDGTIIPRRDHGTTTNR